MCGDPLPLEPSPVSPAPGSEKSTDMTAEILLEYNDAVGERGVVSKPRV
jgi:hypothetical protein